MVPGDGGPGVPQVRAGSERLVELGLQFAVGQNRVSGLAVRKSPSPSPPDEDSPRTKSRLSRFSATSATLPAA